MKAILLLAAALQSHTYDDAYTRAVTSGQPLVVGVGCAPCAGEWDLVLVTSLEGYPSPCIVVSRPSSRTLLWVVTLPATASSEEICGHLRTTEQPRPTWTPPPYIPPMRPMFAPMMRGGGAANC